MLDVHQRIHNYKKKHPRSDPIPSVAASLAQEARLLCIDEMQVTDIADAMIMKRLLTILFDLGVIIVVTSNRQPELLYEGGINRSVFLPFIDTLKKRMIIIRMKGTHDYRRDGSHQYPSHSSSVFLPTYLFPADDISSQRILEQWFSKDADCGETRSETIPVVMGRSVHVERANGNCGWFTFNELCNQPLGAADYLAIANRFDLIIVEHVPQLCGNTYNEARRFVTLIDALYEARTKLIMSSDVSRDNLFLGFDATVETNSGDEKVGTESFISGEGGSSSSSSTTNINTPNGHILEWSATGRIGVSLAQLSSVREVSFSFMRAESRLAEMASSNWGR
jgi:protein AFG1